MPFKIGDSVFVPGRLFISTKMLTGITASTDLKDFTLRIAGVLKLFREDLNSWLIEILEYEDTNAWPPSPDQVAQYGCEKGKFYYWTHCNLIQPNTTQPKIVICKECNTQNEYALPNQKDGSYICYNCPR